MEIALIPIFAFALIWLATSVHRDRETDAEGNPCLRFWGGCVLGGAGGGFFLYLAVIHLHDPFYQRHPENTVVEASMSLLAFLIGLWSYVFRITLRKRSIEVRYPLMWNPTYKIADVEQIEHLGRNNDVIQIKDGRRILVTPLYSGHKDFLEAVRSALSENTSI